MPAQVFGSGATATQLYLAFNGVAPSNPIYTNWKNVIDTQGESALALQIGQATANMSSASLAASVLANLGVSAATTNAEAFAALSAAVVQLFDAYPATSRGQIVLNMTKLLTGLEGNATYGTAAANFNNTTLSAYTYASNTANTTPGTPTTPTGSFTLTTSTDVVNGTAGNDIIVGDWGATTVQASDQINGGAGTDTLKLYGALGSLPTSATGIEVLDLVNPGTASIDLAAISAPTGLTKLQIEQVTGAASTITTSGYNGLSLQLATQNGVGASAVTWAASTTDTALSLQLSGYQGATGVTADEVTVSGAAHTTLNLTSDTAANAVSTLTDATATTVNISAATNLKVSTLTAGAAKTVNVSGAGKVTVSASDLASTVTVDATNNSGGVLYTAEAGGSTLTFKGGSGNDKVTFAAATLTTADVLTGGAGTDTLAINDTALTTSGNLTAVNAQTGFETLGLNTTGASLDMSLLTNGITNVAIGSGNISATTTNSLASSTYTIDNSAGNTGTVSIGNKVGELSTSITLDYGTATAAKTLAALNVNGATTVSLVSTGTGSGGSNVITDFNNMDNSVITVTGSKNLTFTNALEGTGTGSKVDASAFTGVLNLTGSGQADIIIGGTKNDVLNGGAGKDTISGGAGNDSITVSAATQADVLTGGDGADTFKFSGNATTLFQTSNGTSDIVSITDFVAGTDKIGLIDSSTAFTGVTLSTQTVATAADLTAVWGAITGVAASTDDGNVNAVLVTVSAGAAAGTYLYVNDTAGAGVSNANDLLVKLTGLTGTLTSSDFVFA